ncbi:MAG: sel1 repeat family protein [Thermoguttaceae bacterium]|nr:sel1 repeat family protein [Thermoguttaceae bacterium]
MSTRQFAITVFRLIIFVLTSLVVFADEPVAEMDELPPVPTFKLPPESKGEAKEQSGKIADKPDDNEIEDWDKLPPVPTYKPQSPPKDAENSQNNNSNDKQSGENIVELMKEAESGSVEAAMKLAEDAENNNIPAAVEKWLKIAAESGSAEAWYKLGLKAIEKDDDKTAFECLKKSADAGYEDAKIYLAFGYMEGLGTKKDVEKGKALLQSVADSGNVTAIRKLANAYRLGIGFEKNEQKSRDLLNQLYQNAKDDAARIMIAANLWGVNDKDGLKLADELLDKVDFSTTECRENALSLLSVSLLEHCSKNTDKDKTVAQKRFSRLMDILLNAGNEGIDEGTLYAVVKVCEDNTVVPDSEKTRLFQAMERLANLDNPVAMLSLAYLYIKGIGTEKNRYMFEYWLDKAAGKGYAPAQFYAFLFLSDDGAVVSKRKAEYLKLACEAQFPNAVYLYLIACLCCNDDLPEILEKQKVAIVESEGLIDRYLKVRKENNHAEKDANDAALPISDEYLKWGRGRLAIDYNKIHSTEIKRQSGVDELNPDNMISDLCQYDYYINMGDLIFETALCYKREIAGCSYDKTKVHELFLLANELGSERARKSIIDDYWMANEDEKAFEELKKAMDDNIPWAFLAQFKNTCYNPDGTENFEQAFPYLQKAVELNACFANKYLGMCYVLGKGVQQDIEKGVKLLEDNKEYLLLMLLYGKGLGVERDTEKSKRYFAMELAKYDTPNARNIVHRSVDCEADLCIKCFNYEEALICAEYYLYFNKYYLKRMEREGVSHAATFWGLYQTNDKSIRTILRQAAQQGDAFDKAMAGYVLLTRCSDRQLNQEGREALLKAAQAGMSMAMVVLGAQSIKEGKKEDDPVKKLKSLEEGRQWLKQAADKGNMLSYLNVTEMFVDSGIPVDLEEYHRYLDLSVELNYTHAMILKAIFLIRNSKPEDSDDLHQKIVKLFQNASNLGSPAAKEFLQQIDNYSKNNQTTEQNSGILGIKNKDSSSSNSNSDGWYYNEIQKKYFPSSPYDSIKNDIPYDAIKKRIEYNSIKDQFPQFNSNGGN